MKKVILSVCLLHIGVTGFSQNLWSYSIDSMKNAVANASDDEKRLIGLRNLFYRYAWTHTDSAVPYAQQYMRLAQMKNTNDLLIKAYSNFQILSNLTGNYPQALEYGFKSLALAEQVNSFLTTATVYHGIGEVYLEQGDMKRALLYAKKCLDLVEANYSLPAKRPARKIDTLDLYASTSYNLCKIYLRNNQLDSALKYIRVVDWIWGWEWKTTGIRWPTIPLTYGNIYFQKGEYLTANKYYHEGIGSAIHWDVNNDLLENLNGLAQSHRKLNQSDSSIYYAKEVLRVSEIAQNPKIKMEALTLLSGAFKAKNNVDSSAKYFELTLAAKDSLFNQSKVIQMQNLTFNEQLRHQEIEETNRKQTYRYRLYALGAGLLVLLIFLVILSRNNRQKQMAKVKIEQAYDHLKATQQQLIQQEKMASLGELTAGIAHEIQNPLNFVNNFSEVNTELLAEMQDEIDKGHIDDAKAIASNVIENQQKINHHGKRADAIVKGMLQHSRSSSGVKEATDINELADEYFRLAYHGLRAKDNFFNATLKTEYDERIGTINIIPHDIGRVILNLITNAFYAVTEKKKQQPDGYEPMVTLTTKRLGSPEFIPLKAGGDGGTIEIRVADNGNGIPQKALDKIFQPFFTTKPTGQGTGLGLSLAYDIVKAHGGEIKVETREGEGSVFIVHLPNT